MNARRPSSRPPVARRSQRTSSRDALTAAHEAWRAALEKTTRELRAKPHRVSGLGGVPEGTFRKGQFFPGVSGAEVDMAFGESPHPLDDEKPES